MIGETAFIHFKPFHVHSTATEPPDGTFQLQIQTPTPAQTLRRQKELPAFQSDILKQLRWSPGFMMDSVFCQFTDPYFRSPDMLKLQL